MEHVSKLIDPQNLTTQGLSKCSEAESLPIPVLDRVFAVLTAIYGQKWTSLIIDEQMLADMQKVWGHHLRNTELDQIKAALEYLPATHPEWPPTIGQFMELVKSERLPEFRSLPRPWPSEEVAEPAFDELKKILRYRG